MSIQIVDSGAGPAPNVYLDALQFEETGTPLEYTMKPDLETVFHVSEIRLILADNVTGGLSYDKFMGLAKLGTGVVVQIQQDGVVTYSYNWKDLFDMMVDDVHLIDTHDDGVNTAVSLELEFPQELVLNGDTTRNNMCVIINDDLSGLLGFRMVAEGNKEI